MLACWRHAHRGLTGANSLDELADASGLAKHSLANWWAFLQAEEPAFRYLDLTRLAWRRPALNQGRIEGSDFQKLIDFSGEMAIQ
jgi:hypothetical protein